MTSSAMRPLTAAQAAGFGGFDFTGADMGDIFGDIFGDFFGGRTSRGRSGGPMRGANLRTGIRITFEEAVFGCQKEIELNLKDELSQMPRHRRKAGNIAGYMPQVQRKGKNRLYAAVLLRTGAECADVSGLRRHGKSRPVRSVRTATERDISRTARKSRLRCRPALTTARASASAGKGEPGTGGGERGDLLVEITVSQHPIFKRQETSIFSTVPISFAKAALGGTIRIKTVDGEVEYDVKPGTQTDTRVRLKGKGVPSLRNKNIRGDHYVTLVVTVPEKLNEEQKEALRRFDDAMNGIAPEGPKKKRGLFKGLEK